MALSSPQQEGRGGRLHFGRSKSHLSSDLQILRASGTGERTSIPHVDAILQKDRLEL